MKQSFLVPVVLFAAIAAISCNDGSSKESHQTGSASTVSSTDADKANTATLLTRFDSLDFDVYSHQQWDRIGESHADNIVVHYPDGHTTTGIPDHIKELKPLFAFAPDTKITEHPVKFGIDNWTSVIGNTSGTFTQPMVMNGKTIPPTGKKFSFQMSTVGHWKDGKMIEEFLFFDNAGFMKQIGLMP